jgi:hypothetical protein
LRLSLGAKLTMRILGRVRRLAGAQLFELMLLRSNLDQQAFP